MHASRPPEGVRQEPDVGEHVARAKATHPKGVWRWLRCPHTDAQRGWGKDPRWGCTRPVRKRLPLRKSGEGNETFMHPRLAAAYGEKLEKKAVVPGQNTDAQLMNLVKTGRVSPRR